jgi:hypothetical protein
MDDLTMRRYIRRQRESIDMLAASGHNTAGAEILLRAYEKLQALYVANREARADEPKESAKTDELTGTRSSLTAKSVAPWIGELGWLGSSRR